LEILNSGQYASPIIVFVNQKKTADMVAKDLSRAGVSVIFFVLRDVPLTGVIVECCNVALREKSRAA